MSERLHGRRVIFQAGQPGEIGIELEGLPIMFDVQFKRDGKPNQGSFGIRGAAPDLYAACAEKGSVIRLLAGYSLPKLIFVGNPIPRVGCSYSHDGGARLLKVQALDAGNKYATTFLDLSLDGQTTVEEVLKAASDQLGYPTGPIPPGLSSIVLGDGYYSSGPVKSVLNDLAQIGGFTWTLQDESLLIIPDGEDTGETATVLSTETGNLLGLELSKEGTIEFHALLDGSIRPGRRIVFDHPDFKGVARARDVRFVGDPGWDVPFYTDGTARPV